MTNREIDKEIPDWLELAELDIDWTETNFYKSKFCPYCDHIVGAKCFYCWQDIVRANIKDLRVEEGSISYIWI